MNWTCVFKGHDRGPVLFGKFVYEKGKRESLLFHGYLQTCIRQNCNKEWFSGSYIGKFPANHHKVSRRPRIGFTPKEAK